MSPAVSDVVVTEQHVMPAEHYINADHSLKSWLLTVDHKRIAILYMLTITFFFFIGGAMATLVRLELLTPAGDLLESDTYNKAFTMHGVMMIFFFLIPSVPATLGNFLIPDHHVLHVLLLHRRSHGHARPPGTAYARGRSARV